MASQAEIEALAVAKEIAANKRAQAAGWPDAPAYERDANRRSIEAGFANAVDQEIDANRRAREAGFENAALQENPGAAAPGQSIYSNLPFVDPRSPQAWASPSVLQMLDYSNRFPVFPASSGMYKQPTGGLLPRDESTVEEDPLSWFSAIPGGLLSWASMALEDIRRRKQK